ncbi:MAG TPA: transcriptional regulator [Allosphingosinicella sp.]|nr:transcriptional regulator [Allosphingosinicella sp.]
MAGFRFGNFVLDPADRRLRRDDAPVELNARYLDALVLLVSEAGKLVSKDRFLEEVWRGVPVTDEALTQCIKTLRRKLGDDAARPRFIETIPKHGYRFIAPVGTDEDAQALPLVWGDGQAAEAPYGWRQFLLLGGAGTLGAGVAGMVGGLFYGFAGASQPLGPGSGAASVLLVLVWLTMAAALMGGAGVSFGIAASGFASGRPWAGIAGGALGGLVVGGVVKLLGLDAFNLLLGRSPGDITGATEGLLLGGAVGLGAWLGNRGPGSLPLRRSIGAAGLAGGTAGILIPLLGGKLMGGSLDLLARSFPDSRLRLDQIGGLFGETGFGPISQIVTGGFEGALFGGCVVGAMLIARRGLSGNG